jgi:predicted alpha-1,2-mannosidase
MRAKRVSFRHVRVPVAIGAVAGLVALGWYSASGSNAATPAALGRASAHHVVRARATASSPVTAAGPAARRGHADAASAVPAGVCSKDAQGNVVNCPRPVRRGLLPAASRSSSIVSKPIKNLAAFVDTRTWTSGGGNTFPGADVPFGMVQWSPDTSPDRADGGGYSYGDKRLVGYALTHLSGPGCVSGGDIPILPMTGTLKGSDPSTATTSFSHVGEVAQAGYYSAKSNAPNTITSAFSETPHAAIGKFTFPKTTEADFLIKLRDSERGDSASSFKVINRDEIQGSATSGNFCNEYQGGGYGPQTYKIYFDIIFSQNFTHYRGIKRAGQSDPNSVFLTFSTKSGKAIDAKVGISYVSAADAQLNWHTEMSGWDLAHVRSTAQAAWNKLLGEVSVWGGSTAQTQEFYSLLYKDMLQPNIVSDVNGQYLGSDYTVHTVGGGQQGQYANFSGWDMYHSEAQLVAMLDPTVAGDMATSLLNEYAENGILPQWGFLNTDNYTMVGDPDDGIISDFYAFGVTNFSAHTALTDMLAQADTVNTVRPGEALESADGYLPMDADYGCCRLHDEVAALLEYDNADFALSQFAASQGDTGDAGTLQDRANDWADEFDTSSNLLVSRCESGSFLPGVTDTTTKNYVEGDAYEYLWDVPNDYADLFSDLGGDSTVKPMLVKYLSKPEANGQYAKITNEFDEGEQYALDYAGDPAGAQKAVNTIENTVYKPGPYGLTNNDDLGAESSQFIWEMLGVYPENPGNDNLVLGSPGFPHAVITLPNGKKITISAPHASASEFYASALSVSLNGGAASDVSQLYVPFSSLTSGATLDWTMATVPSSVWNALGAPPSYGGAPTPPTPSTSPACPPPPPAPPSASPAASP